MGPTNLHALPSPGAPLDVATTLTGRTLLVTGVTGFVGKVWLSQLLHDLPSVNKVYILARAGDHPTAADRFARVAERSPAFRPLRERHGRGLGAFLAERVEVLDGDVSQPLCGLDADTVARLAPALDAIVHFAGLTDFAPDPRLAFETNVLGAGHVADLAAATEHALLLHCSTCFVAGTTGGHVAETLTPGLAPNQQAYDVASEVAALAEIAARPGDKKARVAAATERAAALGWPNIYTYTKGLAEHMLALRPIELTVIRPAIVECALHYPFSGWNEGINTTGPLLWLLRSPFRHFPARADVHYDVVPVDSVSRGATAVLAAALLGEAAPVYHLATSHSNPVSVGRAIELANLSIRKDLSTQKASRFQRLVVRHLDTVPVDADHEHAFALPRLQRYAKGIQGFLGGLDLKAVLPSNAYKLVGKPLERHKDTAGFLLEHAHRSFGRVQRMLDLFRPFIHDTDWIFVNDHIRALDLRLTDASRTTFGWLGDGIDWRDYWLHVLYPGLDLWCMPRLEGGDIPEDPPMSPPLTLVRPAAPDAAASANAQAVSQ